MSGPEAGWGAELWDRYDGALAHVTRGTEELGGQYAKYVRERGEVEREYARALRKLVAKHLPKETKREKVQESTQVTGFRALLSEVGCQAGQHELLADTLAKEVPGEMAARGKEAARLTKENVRDSRRLQEEVERAYRGLDKSKRGYQRAFADWEAAQATYRRAESDGTISRNEIAKLRHASDSRARCCEDQKMQYASQLARTNAAQTEYFSRQLPGVLDSLHRIEVDRGTYLKQVLEKCVAAEQAIVPIIARCHQESQEIIGRVSPAADAEQLADRLKTGNQPPVDFPFEECQPGEEPRPSSQPQYGTLGRKRSKLNLLSREKGEGEVGLFPRARQIRGQVEELEADITKGNKEIKALQLMVASYTQNPRFGDAKKFQLELDSATHRVRLLESALHALNQELAEVTRGLQQRQPGAKPPSALPLLGSPGGSRASSTRSGSAGYGTQSNCSGSDKDSVDTGGSDSSRLADDFSSELPAERCLALYSYDGQAEASIAMQEGEEVVVTEGDLGGWTRVRRPAGEEGYVPTAYLHWL